MNQYNKLGNKEGHWEVNYPSGRQISNKCYYINGIVNGYWEDYYINGKLMNKGQYINGIRENYWEYYHVDGSIHSKGNLLNGEYINCWQFYNDKKQLIEKTFHL